DDLARAINGLGAVGDTALYDALTLAAQTFGKSGRRILIVLSDGDDTISKAKQIDALGAMQAIEVPVFTVGLGDKVNRAVLDGFATGTGGVALYAPTSEGLVTAYRNIADQLRNQYVISHTSTISADNQRHGLTVRAKVGSAVAEAKSTFVAVSSPPEIIIASPQEGATVSGTVQIWIGAKARGEVVRVEAVAAGRVVAAKEQAPFILPWDTSQLAAGNHSVAITVTDSYGNRATKQMTVRVDPAAKPTAVPPTPVPTSRPPVAASADDFDWLMEPLLAVAAVLGIGVVLVRGRRLRTERRIPMRKVVPPKNCPTCGRSLRRGQPCPTCTAADDEIVRRRLRELGGLPPEDTEEQP
ncbi:MAG: Ig-like domain-containing protein, partial [Chloroflexota bacterium]